MKMPIPQDWNGEWECIEVQWPKSVMWSALLRGLLTMPERGRFWDEKTGTIKDAQAIGRAIYDANIPFNFCSGETETPGTGNDQTQIYSQYIGSDDDCEDCEDCEMSCSIPYGALRWSEDGKLQYLHCGLWYDVDGMTPIDGAIPTDDPEIFPPEIDGGGYSACGKAVAVLDMFEQVITSIFDESGNFPWQWWGHVKNDNPGVHFDAKWVVSACVGVGLWEGAQEADPGYNPNPLDSSTWQSVRCALARDFSNALPETLSGNDIRTKVQNYFASEWSVDVFTNAVFVDAARAVNASSWEDAALLGAGYDDGDCGCPEVFDLSGNVMFEDARTINVQTQGASLYSAERLDLRVMEFILTGGVNENYQEVQWDEKLMATGTVSEIQIELPLVGVTISGFYPAYDWSDTNPTSTGNYTRPTVPTPTPLSVTNYPQPNKQVTVIKWSTPVDLDSAVLRFQVKMNPKDQSPTRQIWTFRAMITYAGAARA